MANLDTTRRAMLGAMVAVPAMGLVAMPATALSNFKSALMAYRDAEKVLDANERAVFTPARDRWVAAGYPNGTEFGQIFDRHCAYEDACNDNREKLIATRCSSLAELREKIDLIDEWGSFDIPHYFEEVAIDIRRLASN